MFTKREKELVFLFRRFARRNPAYEPRARAATADDHIRAAAECLKCCPSSEWAGKFLIDASTSIEVPHSWREPTVGSMRRHAADSGGMTAHNLRILAEVTVDFDPDFGIKESDLVKEITHARQWACAHGEFVKGLIQLSELNSDTETDEAWRKSIVEHIKHYMEIVESPCSEPTPKEIEMATC